MRIYHYIYEKVNKGNILLKMEFFSMKFDSIFILHILHITDGK